MNNYNFGKLVANERKNEIERELAVRHMLKEANGGILKVSKTRRLVMRFAPAVIILSILAFIILT